MMLMHLMLTRVFARAGEDAPRPSLTVYAPTVKEMSRNIWTVRVNTLCSE